MLFFFLDVRALHEIFGVPIYFIILSNVFNTFGVKYKSVSVFFQNQIQKQQNKYVKLISKTTLSKQNYDSIINIFNNANSNDFETTFTIECEV